MLVGNSYTYPNTQAPCPTCGHCPHCGRGGYYQSPYIWCQQGGALGSAVQTSGYAQSQDSLQAGQYGQCTLTAQPNNI